MSLQKRMTWLLIALAGFALAATFGTIYAVRLHVEDAIASLQRSMDEAAWIDRMRLETREQYVRLREALDGQREIDELYRAQQGGFFDELRQVAQFALRENRGRAAEELRDLTARLRRQFDRCLLLAQSGEHERAREALHGPLETQLLPALDLCLRDARSALDDSRNRSVDELVATNTQVLILALVIGVLGIGLVTVSTALVHRWIIVPVRRLHEATQQFSRGNLAFRLRPALSDELGALGQALNRMAEGLANAQVELQVSEAKHRSLFRNLRDAAVICDGQGRVVECHDGDTKLLSRFAQDYSGRLLHEIWPNWDAQTFSWPALLERVLTRGTQARMMDLRPPPRAGEAPTIIDLIAYPIEFGQARYLAIVLRDVTERKQAEDALRESEQRYRLLFEHNLAGVYRTTLDGRILDCNESMAAMLGYESREELLSYRSSDLYSDPADREAFITQLRKTGVLTNSELRLRRKDGTAIHILENVRLVPDEQGALTLIQGTMIEITKRRRAEEALRESEQRYRAQTRDLRRLMERLHGVREDERARIARELHDELGQALTALNMDLYWLEGRSWRESEVTLARISSMGKLLNTTIHAVRRICSDLRPAVLDDFGLIAAIEWQARDFQARTGIRCQVSLPTTAPTLPGEQTTTVFRIFQESLTNIARYARATEAQVTLNVGSDMLTLVIVDNGVGITEEQATGPRSVGLAGMRERALRWGGQVEINGVPGEGTTVVLQMPVEQRDREPQP